MAGLRHLYLVPLAFVPAVGGHRVVGRLQGIGPISSFGSLQGEVLPGLPLVVDVVALSKDGQPADLMMPT